MTAGSRGAREAHLGDEVSALLDDALTSEETERAWRHVARCERCRVLVEREGWLKARLGALAVPGEHPRPAVSEPPAWVDPPRGGVRGRRRTLAAAGVGSLGAAVIGFAAFAGAPAARSGEDPVGAVTTDLAGLVTESVASASTLWGDIAR